MTPTNELRFVERVDNSKAEYKTLRILQQKWVDYKPLSMTVLQKEWRDVPVEKEPKT
jgi:hypothetical protein